MIISFEDEETEAIYEGASTKSARRRLPVELWKVARRKLDQLGAAKSLEDLSAPPNNRLEALRADRKGQHSIRINDQYRICFVWTQAGPDRVEVTDYH